MRSTLIVIAVLTLCTLCAGNAFGQSASDIEAKYDKPFDVYSVSEHIWMTPEYDAEGQVCFMRLYPKRISRTTNYLGDNLSMDEVLKVIDELIPVNARGDRKESFGMTETGGGVAWTHFNYERVSFTFVSSFRLDENSVRALEESSDFNFSDFKFDENSLAEARRKEAMRPDGELMRERTAKPQVLEIRWANRKCSNP